MSTTTWMFTEKTIFIFSKLNCWLARLHTELYRMFFLLVSVLTIGWKAQSNHNGLTMDVYNNSAWVGTPVVSKNVPSM